MVIPSSSISAPCKPHIGSDFGGGILFAVMPESQWPAALPTQQAIVFDFVREALATGSNVAINEKAIVNATKGRVTFRLSETICL
ncbi:MAG TPA: hypothetical protein VGQ41_25220 [Pyrinomonadaceae bacterium]|nr:hypothetical protein [Pyrinomonadaceae bacterium]